MKKTVLRPLICLLCACLLCTGALCPNVLAADAPQKPQANDEIRHTLCRALSAQAEEYYAGNAAYSALSSLPGAEDAVDSFAAMQNNALFDALHSLMEQTQTYCTTYSGYGAGSLAYYWSVTDSTLDTDSYVMFYSDYDSGAEGVRLNREHIWPKSRASFQTTGGGADLHHLRPSAESVNMEKSDHMFGFVNETYETGYSVGENNGIPLYWLEKEDDLFECKDDVKGDVARILLYVYCRWQQPNLYSDVDQADLPALDEDDRANNGKRVVESLDTLLQWCALDPVDTWEMERNDRIEEIQGNRNVFIDYPELAWQLFGRSVPDGLSTPTHEGCAHQWAESGRQPANCGFSGSFTLSCPLCGGSYDRRLAATGQHSDADCNEICDVCSCALSIPADLELTDTLRDGMHFVIFHPASGFAAGKRLDDAFKLESKTVYLRGDVLHPVNDCAVFTAQAAPDGGWYFCCGGNYLTSGKTGTRFYWDETPSEYSVWFVEPLSDDGLVRLVNQSAQYYGKKQAIECYNGSFMVYSVSNSDYFRMRLYGIDDHVLDAGTITKEPTCKNAGTLKRTCVLCAATKTETLPATGNHTTVILNAREATATEDGYTGDEVCTVCGETIKTGEVIPATGENTPDEPDDGKACPFCGEVHGTNVFERIIKVIHYLYCFIAWIVNAND